MITITERISTYDRIHLPFAYVTTTQQIAINNLNLRFVGIIFSFVNLRIYPRIEL